MTWEITSIDPKGVRNMIWSTPFWPSRSLIKKEMIGLFTEEIECHLNVRKKIFEKDLKVI